MADNEEIIQTVKLELDPGNTVQQTSNLAKQLSDALTQGFRPDLSIRPDAAAKSASDSAKVFSERYSEAFIKSLGGLHLDFLRRHGPQITTPPSEPRPSGPGEAPEARNLAKSIEPFLSGVEAMAMVLRGAPITSLAQMIGQAARGFSELRGANQLAGGRAGETREAAIGRRLRESGAAPEAAEEAAGKSVAQRFGKGSFVVTEIIGGIAAVGSAAYETRKLIREAGEEGADTTIQWNDMAKTMGLTEKQFVTMNYRLQKSGINADDLNRSFVRMGLAIKREMPEIEREVARTDDSMAESHIKVADASRKVVSAGLEHQAAVEGITKAEGELVKVQQTGAATRAQQAQAAQLAVAKAEIGARQAVAQAPLTVAGAKLGLQGAQLSAEDARARLAEIASGQKEDPEAARQRELRKAMHAVEVAELNEKQAAIRAREAKPEAEIAKEQALLHERQSQTAEQRLQIDQQYNPLRNEENAAIRNRIMADQRAAAAPDRDTEAAIAERDALKDEARRKYMEVGIVQPELQKIARGERPSPGFSIEEALGHPETIRKAIFRQGGYQIGGLDAGGALGFTQDLLRGMAALGYDESQRTSLLGDVAQGRGLVGPRLRKLRVGMEKPTQALTPEEERLTGEAARSMRERLEEAEETESVIGGARGRGQIRGLLRQQDAMGPARRVTPRLEADDIAADTAKRLATKAVDVGDRFNDFMSGQGAKIEQGGDHAAKSIETAGDHVAGSLEDVAGKIKQAVPSSEKPPDGGGGGDGGDGGGDGGGSDGEITAQELAQGGPTGLLHGPGTGTSDSIPINASAGEYIVKASRVQELGVPFLDYLNTDGVNMQAGGSVERERKRMEEERRKFREKFGSMSTEELQAQLQSLRGLKPGEKDVNPAYPRYDPSRTVRGTSRRDPGPLFKPDNRRTLPAAPSGDKHPYPSVPMFSRQQLIEFELSGRGEPWQKGAPSTSVIRENPFFGKTPAEQAAMRPTGTGIRINPFFKMPAETPAEPKAAAAAEPQKLQEPQEPVSPSTSLFGSFLRGDFLKATPQAEGPALTPLSAAIRDMFSKPAEGPPVPSEIAYPISREPQPKYDTGSAETQENYQTGGVVGAGLISEEDLRKVGMTKHKYSTAVDNPAAKAYAKSWFDSFANLGRLMTGKSEDVPADIMKAGTDFLGSGFGVKKAFEEVVKAGSSEALRFAPHLLEKLVPEKERKPDVRDLGVKPEMLLTKLPDEEESHAAGGRIGMQHGGFTVDPASDLRNARSITGKAFEGARMRFKGFDVNPASDLGNAKSITSQAFEGARMKFQEGGPVGPIAPGTEAAIAAGFASKGLDFPLMPGQSTADASGLSWRIRMRAAVVNPSLLQEARQAQQMMRGYAMGGFIGPFTETAASMQGYAGGGAVSTRSAGGGGSTLSYHQLDLRTNAGTFRAGVSEDTMDSLRYSSLGSKMTQTGPRPSWYS